jgi:hypothetical protein
MAVVSGLTKWSVSLDKDGHRTYSATFRVLADVAEGPLSVVYAPGLPLPGDLWATQSDFDPWGYCTKERSATPVVISEPNTDWDVEIKFSSKPLDRCQDDKQEDPLLLPPKISGNFVKFTQEATEDRFGSAIQSTSFEQFRGPQVEFDDSRPTVKIQMNVADLQLPLLTSMRDTVNEFSLWGLDPRTIKLSNISWERKFYGSCYIYYDLSLEFDINFNTFDKDLLNEGTKCVAGYWDQTTDQWIPILPDGGTPDPLNPAHYVRFKDRNGENARCLLDTDGTPLDSDTDPNFIHVEKYEESDFLLLGIPTSF